MIRSGAGREPGFAPLHTKSDLSPGYGTTSVEALVAAAAARGLPAIALTDVENLYGQVRLHAAARQAGVRPISGVELRSGYGPRALGRKEGRLVLLAKDERGWQSLCRVVTRRRTGPAGDGGEPIGCLEADPAGVFFLSDDPSVVLALLRAGVAPGDVRFLLVRPGGAEPPEGVLAVADTDAVLLDPADHDLHVLQVAIRTGRKVHEVFDAETPERSLPSASGARRLFADRPDALAEGLRLAEACSLDLDRRAPVLPDLGLEPGETAAGRLESTCRSRLADGRREGRFDGAAYDLRLARELSVVRDLGFDAYLLAVAEIGELARRLDIPIAGRGSAGGSFAVHLLGLSSIDPVEHGLLFERFLHAGRRDLPDVDLDVASDRREELLRAVFRRHGRGRAAMVSAHQTFRLRGAYREGLKALGLAAGDVDRFFHAFPAEELEGEGIPAPVHLLPGRFREAAPRIERLVGRLRHVSVHPGGVVLAPGPIERHTALERAPKGVLVTQVDMRSAKALGLVKIDVLGNRSLAALAQAFREAGGPIEAPAADPATTAALRQARTVGCFQIETPALRATLRRLPVRGVRDLAAALAVVRPGPASGEAKASFLRRANGEEAPEPPHPRLAGLLRETFGLPLFEEDLVLSIAETTGWTVERADALREELVRAGGDPDRLAALEREYTCGAGASGLDEDEARGLWLLLVRFASYSFNRAHATSYADLAWRSAFVATRHPPAFAAGVLDHYGGAYPLRTVAADLARRGVRILRPDVDRSGVACRLEDGAVRIGLGRVKRLTAKGRERVLEARPFRDVADLLSRVRLSRSEVEALVRSGACDGLSPLGEDVFPFAHEDVLSKLGAPSRPALRGLTPRAAGDERVETWRALVRIRDELATLDMHPSSHPMAVLRSEASRLGCATTADLAASSSGAAGDVLFAGLVAAARRLLTRSGRPMMFVTFEDEHGLVEAALLPETYARLSDPVRNPGPWLVAGRRDLGDLLHVSDLRPFHLRPRPYGRSESPHRAEP